MNIREVARAFREMVIPKEHEDEVYYHIERSYGVEEIANELFQIDAEEEKSKSESRNR
jgi:hypothetical protein